MAHRLVREGSGCDCLKRNRQETFLHSVRKGRETERQPGEGWCCNNCSDAICVDVFEMLILQNPASFRSCHSILPPRFSPGAGRKHRKSDLGSNDRNAFPRVENGMATGALHSFVPEQRTLACLCSIISILPLRTTAAKDSMGVPRIFGRKRKVRKN